MTGTRPVRYSPFPEPSVPARGVFLAEPWWNQRGGTYDRAVGQIDVDWKNVVVLEE